MKLIFKKAPFWTSIGAFLRFKIYLILILIFKKAPFWTNMGAFLR